MKKVILTLDTEDLIVISRTLGLAVGALQGLATLDNKDTIAGIVEELSQGSEAWQRAVDTLKIKKVAEE